MLFKIAVTNADTCGNEWDTGESKFVEADNIKVLWEKLNKPFIHTYWKTGEKYGIPHYIRNDVNPKFDFENEYNTIHQFESGAFCGVRVTKIEIENI